MIKQKTSEIFIIYFRSFYSKLFEMFHRRLDHHGIIGMIDYKARRTSGCFLHMLFLNIIDFHLAGIPPLGIVGGQGGSLFKDAVGSSFPSDFTMTWLPGIPLA